MSTSSSQQEIDTSKGVPAQRVIDKSADESGGVKRDVINIAILASIALFAGIYLIATTVLISKDGITWIEAAQEFSNDPAGAIKAYWPGFPLILFAAHEFVGLFTDSSAEVWIYSAQSVTLLCRLLAIIPLYFTGKLLVGRRNSFWAIFILMLLPYPAHICCEVLREWPYVLFLVSGFYLLLLGARKGKWWMFGAVGLVSGLGVLIRHECVQLVVYGVLWLFAVLFRARPNMSRLKHICALTVLLVGFLAPTFFYFSHKEHVLSPEIRTLLWRFKHAHSFPEKDVTENSGDPAVVLAGGSPGRLGPAVGQLAEGISEHLMYFFVPVLLAGVYCRLRKGSGVASTERFFMTAFVSFNVVMLLLLYCSRGYMSRRHCMPLIVILALYLPIGLEKSACWFAEKLSKKADGSNSSRQRWFFGMLAAGVVICLPKLLSPAGIKKDGYRDASEWLKQNTSVEDVIVVPDKRISFYAERKGVLPTYEMPGQGAYVVKIVKDDEDTPVPVGGEKEVYSGWVDKRRRQHKVMIYKRPDI